MANEGKFDILLPINLFRMVSKVYHDMIVHQEHLAQLKGMRPLKSAKTTPKATFQKLYPLVNQRS